MKNYWITVFPSIHRKYLSAFSCSTTLLAKSLTPTILSDVQFSRITPFAMYKYVRPGHAKRTFARTQADKSPLEDGEGLLLQPTTEYAGKLQC